MLDFTKGKSDGGYVFVSHSHKDMHEVRKIRNTLEDSGLEPICFYLRCLSDDDEIIDLIKREIDAREWFILVDSENARESNWVKTEVEYIKSKNPKKMISVSLEEQDAILPTLKRLSSSMTVFLSYAHSDDYIARAIYNECVKHDFKVFYDAVSIQAGDAWADSIADSIIKAAEYGCVVVIVSAESVKSNHVKRELFIAYEENAFILPIIVDDVQMPGFFGHYLAFHQRYHLKSPVTAEQAEEIVRQIERISIRRLEGRDD